MPTGGHFREIRIIMTMKKSAEIVPILHPNAFMLEVEL